MQDERPQRSDLPYASSSLLNIFVGFIYKKRMKSNIYKQGLLNKGLSRQEPKYEKYNHLNWAHRGFTPNHVVVRAGCRPTVQAQRDEWYHIVMCYNNTEPREGALHLLKHFQSSEENHLKSSLFIKAVIHKRVLVTESLYILFLMPFFFCVESNANCYFVQCFVATNSLMNTVCRQFCIWSGVLKLFYFHKTINAVFNSLQTINRMSASVI